MSVVSVAVGASTPTGATFVAQVDGLGPVRVAVSNMSSMVSPVFTAAQAINAQGVARVSITALNPDSQYFYQVEDNGVLDTSVTGEFRTHPALNEAGSTFTVAMASCAGSSPQYPGINSPLASDRISNSPIFSTVANQNPLMFIHMGDLFYYDLGSGNHGIVGGGSVANYRRAYDDIFNQPQQAQLYRSIPTVYLWDDHDYGPNNSDGSLATKANAASVYRERWPHYPLEDPAGIWQSWQIGRVLFIGSDVRYYRTPNLTPDGGGLVLDGVASSYASTPDNAVLDITGSIDVRAEISLPLWTGTVQTIAGKWVSAGQRSWIFRIDSTGALSFNWATTGADNIARLSTVLIPAGPDDRLGLRATLQTNDDNGGHIVTFYTAPSIDGPWDQLGDPVLTAGVTSIFNSTAPVTVGSFNTGSSSPLLGTVHAVEVRNGLNGPVVTGPDFTAQETGDTLFNDEYGRTWTVNGAATIVNKTMLGTDQKEWMEGLLSSTAAELLVWVTPSQYLVGEDVDAFTHDTWAAFGTERDELVAMLDSYGWLDRMVMTYGDRHAIGISSGATNDWGGFPVMMAAALDSPWDEPSIPEPWDAMPEVLGPDHYGTITFDDQGSVINVTMTAWEGATEIGSYSQAFPVPFPVPPSVVGDIVRGSYDVKLEARILDTFQVGPEPDGVIIDILDGDVTFDATAKIRGRGNLTVPGSYGQDGASAFPRGKDVLLAPFGNEVFLRYGIDLGGGGILWVSLGYYRITDTDQSDTAWNPIKLDLDDRMATIIDSDLINQRSYAPGTTVRNFIEDLVLDVYPDAIVVFDTDDSTDGVVTLADTGSLTLGRLIVVEKNRYEAIKEVCDGIGKIVYWDDEGFLRIETPPDPDLIAWEVDAGFHGVLTNARRQLTRKDVFNVAIVNGEGADDTPPVRAVAYNADPTSPVRYGGPFGKVPHELTTPTVSTYNQALNAARQLLIRSIGSPHSIKFSSIVNPTLRPYQSVRITHNDGNRDVHILDSITIPLDEENAMSGDTRHKTQIVIGEL